MLRYETLSRSAGLKKWVSAAAAADFGNSQALWVPPSRISGTREAIAVGAARLLNRSGAAAEVGLAVRFPVSTWTAGQVTAAGVYTADTADAQDEGVDDFPMHDRADSGSGFLVSCGAAFTILGIIQGVAGDQVTPVTVADYWNGAWTNLALSLFINDGINALTGEKILCWPQPSDWVPGGSGTGVPANKFNLRVRTTHSGAGTVNPVASQLFVGFAKLIAVALADDGSVTFQREHECLFPAIGEALFPLFSVAHRGNTVEVDVRPV